MKNLSVVIADSDAGRGALIGNRLMDVTTDRAHLQAHACATLEALFERLGSEIVDAILLATDEEAGFGTDTVSQLNQRYGDLPILVLSPEVDVQRELEWVHRGAQDVLRVTADPDGMVRAILLAMERKHLHNDIQQALRLERESVVKLQGFIDDLVGYATKSSVGRN